MDRYIKYKDVCKLCLFNDQLKNSTSSQYSVFQSTISSVTVSAGGSNYNTSNLGFRIDGGGGSGLLLSATVTSNAISAITILDGGFNYSSAPTITTTSGVNLISVTAPGSGYGTIEGNVVVNILDPGDGQGFEVGAVTLTSGTITAVAIKSSGQGYARAPTLTVSGAGGSGAVLTPVIGTGAVLTVPSITNSKRIRYLLNGNLNNIVLSKYAKCVLESMHIPAISNMTNNVILLRMVTSTADKHFDSLNSYK